MMGKIMSLESVALSQSREIVKTLAHSDHPALSRLSTVVRERNEVNQSVNYSRMHHRHNRSHTRK